MANAIEEANDVLMLTITIAIIGALLLGYKAIKKFIDGLGKPENPSGPTPTPDTPFKLSPASAKSTNTLWQWITYLFNMPEGFMSSDQVQAAGAQMSGSQASSADYPGANGYEEDPGIASFARDNGLA